MNVNFDMPDLKLRTVPSESVGCLDKREKRTMSEERRHNESANKGSEREREREFTF